MKFKLRRIELGLTQAQLQELSGVSRVTIANIERNGYVPSPRIAKKLAAALRIDWQEFYQEKEV
jgi:DNA-binding XRE family transcriptional regulator